MTCHGLAGLVQARAAMMSPEREAMTYKDLQSTLDFCAASKAQYGIHIPKDKDGHVDLDEALKAKMRETKKITEKMNQYWSKHFEGGKMREPADAWQPTQEWAVGTQDFMEHQAPSSLLRVGTTASMIAAAVAGAAVTMLTQRACRSVPSRHAGLLVPTHDDRAMRFASAESELELQQ